MFLVRCFILQLVHQNEELFHGHLWTNADFYLHCFVTIPGLLEATLKEQEEPALQKQQARPPQLALQPVPKQAPCLPRLLYWQRSLTALYLSHTCPKDAPLGSVSATGTESIVVCVSVTLHGAGCSEATAADAATPAKYTYGERRCCCFIAERGKTESKK